MQKQLYIIGDVHGCYKTLMALVNKLPKDAKLCFVGDLCDRGSDSSKVIDFVKSNKHDSVLGNHEVMYIDAIEVHLEDKEISSDTKFWLNRCGGDTTIQSYIDKHELLKSHLNWIKTLPLHIEYRDLKTKDGRYLVVSHSHVHKMWEYRNSPKDSIDYESFKTAVLFGRNKDFDNKEIFNVFGHTPIQNPIIEKHKANIDLGCVYKPKNPNLGKLCALEFPSMNIITQDYLE